MSVNTMVNGRPDSKRAGGLRSLRQDRRGAAPSMRSTPDRPGDTIRHGRKGLLRDRRGAVGVWSAMIVLMGLAMGSLTVDMGFLWVLRDRLQATADASALAGASQLGVDEASVKAEAVAYAQKNMSTGGHGTVLADADVVLGHWDADTRTFTPKGTTVGLETACSNPMPQETNPNC